MIDPALDEPVKAELVRNLLRMDDYDEALLWRMDVGELEKLWNSDLAECMGAPGDFVSSSAEWPRSVGPVVRAWRGRTSRDGRRAA